MNRTFELGNLQCVVPGTYCASVRCHLVPFAVSSLSSLYRGCYSAVQEANGNLLSVNCSSEVGFGMSHAVIAGLHSTLENILNSPEIPEKAMCEEESPVSGIHCSALAVVAGIVVQPDQQKGTGFPFFAPRTSEQTRMDNQGAGLHYMLATDTALVQNRPLAILKKAVLVAQHFLQVDLMRLMRLLVRKPVGTRSCSERELVFSKVIESVFSVQWEPQVIVLIASVVLVEGPPSVVQPVEFPAVIRTGLVEEVTSQN